MEEVLVIGGAGFLGSHLVRMLREDGHPVRIMSRSAGIGKAPEPGIRYFRGETANDAVVNEAVQGVSVVFDLSFGDVSTRIGMERDFIGGARNIGNACLRHGVRRLIYTSTTAALELGKVGVIRDEDGTDLRAEERPGFYHIGKIGGEKLLYDLHRTKGLGVVVLRPAIIMGRGGKLIHSGIGTWRDSNRALVVGRGDHPLPFVLVEDVARAFVLAKDAPGIEGKGFNLVGDVRPSSRDMVRYIGDRSMRQFSLHTQNIYFLQALSLVKYMIKKIVGKDGDYPSWHGLKFERVIAQVDCSGAKKYLGWKPCSELETFLREAVDSHLRPIPRSDLRLEKPAPGEQLA